MSTIFPGKKVRKDPVPVLSSIAKKSAPIIALPAEMRFLKPEHTLLNYPNKITKKDFNGWIQERGLYFASDLDKTHYETIFSGNDTDESLKEGSVLYAQYGKGYYIYTGLSFFRELPAGVTGAYRLFANMISVGKK